MNTMGADADSAIYSTINPAVNFTQQSGGVARSAHCIYLDLNKNNSIYTNNGLVLPSSISKQSYIIYK